MVVCASASPIVRSFSFDDGAERAFGGSAVVVAPSEPFDGPFDGERELEDFVWSKDQTRAFLAGEPLTLRFVAQPPLPQGSQRVYVCCWITVDSE